MGPLRSASGALVEGLRSRGLGFAAMMGWSMAEEGGQAAEIVSMKERWRDVTGEGAASYLYKTKSSRDGSGHDFKQGEEEVKTRLA